MGYRPSLDLRHGEDILPVFPTVLAIQRMFKTLEMPQSYDDILKKIRIFLTGFKSHLEHDGALIRVADLPDIWEAHCPFPDWIDESIFK